MEDAGINASAPPQQLWQDGWLLRFSAGKAKRARCINAVAAGRLSLDDKLQLAGNVMARAGLPLIVRITPFSQPVTLDAQLAARGYTVLDDTRVMVCATLVPHDAAALPPGTSWVALDATQYAPAVGALRGSPLPQQRAHAERLLQSPVPYTGHAVVRDDDGTVLACGQLAQEGALVGLYDVFTAPAVRGQGFATLVCTRLLSRAAQAGATAAYLQVEHDNTSARSIYTRLGFSEAYAYHYRQAPPAG